MSKQAKQYSQTWLLMCLCCNEEYLLYVCRSGSMDSPLFIHIALIDWAACFCLADNFLGALVKVTP